MCLPLAGLHISVVFSKQLIHDLPILCMGKKGPFEGHDRPADFNVIMYKKFTDMDSGVMQRKISTSIWKGY